MPFNDSPPLVPVKATTPRRNPPACFSLTILSCTTNSLPLVGRGLDLGEDPVQGGSSGVLLQQQPEQRVSERGELRVGDYLHRVAVPLLLEFQRGDLSPRVKGQQRKDGEGDREFRGHDSSSSGFVRVWVHVGLSPTQAGPRESDSSPIFAHSGRRDVRGREQVGRHA